MKILITGAAGAIGHATGDALVDLGFDVVGCDVRPAAGARFPIQLVDLVTSPLPADLVHGREALLHLANHADHRRAPAERIIAENAAMNDAVFAAATGGGVRTLVFASTMQVFNGPTAPGSASRAPPYLPLDGHAPYRYAPDNAYAQSKRAAEERLRDLAREHPRRAFVVVRLPRVIGPDHVRSVLAREHARACAGEAFAFLSLEEVAPLVAAIVRARLEGYRCYFPAARDNLLFQPPAAVIARHFAEVPLRAPRDRLDALVDTSEITRDTGWRPGPAPFLRGPRAWIQRLRHRAEDVVGRPLPRPTRRLASALASARRGLWLEPRTLGTARLVLDARAALGEGPCWHADERRLYWVDLLAGALHRFDPISGHDEVMTLGESVSAVFAARERGVLVALQGALAWVDFARRAVEPHPASRIDGPPNRLNDGGVDPTGRVWIGSMHTSRLRKTGALLCVHPDGRVERRLEGLDCPNGLRWSPDGRTLWLAESGDRVIDAFDYDPHMAAITRRRTIVAIPPWLGAPDGMCVDADGKLWVALFGGGAVVRVDPDQRRILGAVRVPARDVTSCAFGGPDLDALYITTARLRLSPRDRARAPTSGGLFVYRPPVPGARLTPLARGANDAPR